MCKPTREESSVPREPLDAHAHIVVDGLMAGRVIPLLGAGVNLIDRPPGDPWQAGRELPNGAELAVHLAQRFSYTEEPIEGLARVSQYVATMSGSGPLYEELRTVFAVPSAPSRVHRFLASLPAALEVAGHPKRHQLIVSTNYDDALERAFEEAGEPFDLVCYIADRSCAGDSCIGHRRASHT